MDRTSQLATDGPVQDHVTVDLAESSQNAMLIDNLESNDRRVMDSTVPDFYICKRKICCRDGP
jgi:hypothetical protein